MENTENRIPTYEEFMTLLAEDRKRSQEEWAKRQEYWEKSEKEWAEIKAAAKKTDERIRELGEQIGGVSNNIGYHAEQFFQDTLARTLTFGGEKYDGAIQNMRYSGKGESAEFDIVLVNGKSVAIIEVKNRIHPSFVKEIAEEKIAKFRRFFPKYNDCKAYLGIAGFSFDKAVLDEARKYGVGIVKQVGEAIEVVGDELKVY